jgi:16S rRNA processing protein RimM
VRPLTDQPGRFADLAECIVWDPARDSRASRRVDQVRRQGAHMIVKLAGVDGPDAARGLAGQFLAVPATQAAPLEPGSFYPWQLEGCRVETEDGTWVGEVVGIERGPAQDLWVVEDGARDHLVPAVPEIVRVVDLAAKRVVIRPPEGLLEL